MKNLLNHQEARNKCVTKGLYSFFDANKHKKAAESCFLKNHANKKQASAQWQTPVFNSCSIA